MKIKLAIIAASLFAAQAASAQTYVGVGVGQSKLKGDAVDYVTDHRATSVDDKDTTGKAFIGYQFNRNFALEGSYNYLGHYAASNRFERAEVQGRSLGLDAVATLPLTQNFGLLGRVGVARTRVTGSAQDLAFIYTGRGHDTAVHYGLGAQYKLSEKVALRGEVERAKAQFGDSKNHVNTATVSLVYSFGAKPVAAPVVQKTTYVAPTPVAAEPAPVYTPAPVAAPAPVEAPVVTTKKVRE